eukprot:SAG11_NODE_27112_length_335_cov_2.578059_1_plen_65_part_10
MFVFPSMSLGSLLSTNLQPHLQWLQAVIHTRLVPIVCWFSRSLHGGKIDRWMVSPGVFFRTVCLV